MYEQGEENHYILTKSVDHSLTRFNSNLKLCEWENVVKDSDEL